MGDGLEHKLKPKHKKYPTGRLELISYLGTADSTAKDFAREDSNDIQLLKQKATR